MAVTSVEDQPVVLCEPMTPEEWNDFLEAVGEGLRTGEIENEDVPGIISRQKELM